MQLTIKRNKVKMSANQNTHSIQTDKMVNSLILLLPFMFHSSLYFIHKNIELSCKVDTQTVRNRIFIWSFGLSYNYACIFYNPLDLKKQNCKVLIHSVCLLKLMRTPQPRWMQHLLLSPILPAIIIKRKI